MSIFYSLVAYIFKTKNVCWHFDAIGF